MRLWCVHVGGVGRGCEQQTKFFYNNKTHPLHLIILSHIVTLTWCKQELQRRLQWTLYMCNNYTFRRWLRFREGQRSVRRRRQQCWRRLRPILVMGPELVGSTLTLRLARVHYLCYLCMRYKNEHSSTGPRTAPRGKDRKW